MSGEWVSEERGGVSGESLMATSRWLIVAGQQVNRNHRLLVKVPSARLIATESLVKVSNQRIQQMIRNFPCSRLDSSNICCRDIRLLYAIL